MSEIKRPTNVAAAKPRVCVRCSSRAPVPGCMLLSVGREGLRGLCCPMIAALAINIPGLRACHVDIAARGIQKPRAADARFPRARPRAPAASMHVLTHAPSCIATLCRVGAGALPRGLRRVTETVGTRDESHALARARVRDSSGRADAREIDSFSRGKSLLATCVATSFSQGWFYLTTSSFMFGS